MKVSNSINCISNLIAAPAALFNSGSISKVHVFMAKTGSSLVKAAGSLTPANSLKGLSINLLSRNAAVVLGVSGVALTIFWAVFKLVNSGKFSDSAFLKNFKEFQFCRSHLAAQQDFVESEKIVETVSQKVIEAVLVEDLSAKNVLESKETSEKTTQEAVFNNVDSDKDRSVFSSDYFLLLADFKF